MKQVTGDQINTVLRVVKSMSSDGDEQLAILGRAFVIACRSCRADRDMALENIEAFFDEKTPLVPLEQSMT
jgi:hypothetical protein